MPQQPQTTEQALQVAPAPRFAVCRWVQQTLEHAIAAIMGALVLIVLWGVFTRFWLESASFWTEEAARLLLIWLTMFGAAVASARAEHLGLDYLVNKLDPGARRLLAIFSELVFAGFAAAVLVYGGSVLVQQTLAANQLTPALGMKMGYVYLGVPIGGICLVLFSFERIYELFVGRRTHCINELPQSATTT